MSQLSASPDKKNNRVSVLRWIARIGSVVCIGFLLLIFIGEGFDPATITNIEWLMLLCFPVGVVLGMIVGWWQEMTGGVITAVSLILFYLIDTIASNGPPDGWWFFLFALPGLLFLLCGWLDRKS
jgi:hypothetical protein